VAKARQALHAVVEPDQLQIARVWDKSEFMHQMDTRARNCQARATAALAAHAAATTVAFAAHQFVAAFLAAWSVSLATRVFVPVGFHFGKFRVPVTDNLAACTPVGSVGATPEG
jgi:hypothetical protein